MFGYGREVIDAKEEGKFEQYRIDLAGMGI